MMDNIKNVLSATLKDLGISRKFNAQSVIVHWREIVGDEIAAHSDAISLSHGVLRIVVNNPVWSHHLMMLRQNLIKKINLFIGESLVKEIIFTAGSGKKSPIDEQAVNGEEPQFSLPLLDPVEIENARQVVLSVDSVNLRNKIFYAIIKQMALNKMRTTHRWHPCRHCGVLCPPDKDSCTVCSIEQKKLRLAALYDLIRDLPWCGYQEIKKYVECSDEEFAVTKKRMIQKLRRKVVEGKADGITKAAFVMAMTGKNPQDISQGQIDGMVDKIMEKAGGKKDVFAPRS